MKEFRLIEAFQIDENKLLNFLTKIESLYEPNPYHNALHGIDVSHSLLYFITQTSILRFMSSIDTLVCIISSLCHDVGHPGFTNRFLVQTQHPTAILYND